MAGKIPPDPVTLGKQNILVSEAHRDREFARWMRGASPFEQPVTRRSRSSSVRGKWNRSLIFLASQQKPRSHQPGGSAIHGDEVLMWGGPAERPHIGALSRGQRNTSS